MFSSLATQSAVYVARTSTSPSSCMRNPPLGPGAPACRCSPAPRSFPGWPAPARTRRLEPDEDAAEALRHTHLPAIGTGRETSLFATTRPDLRWLKPPEAPSCGRSSTQSTVDWRPRSRTPPGGTPDPFSSTSRALAAANAHRRSQRSILLSRNASGPHRTAPGRGLAREAAARIAPRIPAGAERSRTAARGRTSGQSASDGSRGAPRLF
eukprot:scaffold260_cov274-Pinguiococcus_pyrenoidosus.AAC.24